MADDLREIKDRAAREMARSNWGRAFEAFAELSRAEPQDGQWPLRAGEALRKLGRSDEAARFFARAAEVFHERGFLVRAIAVAKLVADLSGDHTLLRQMDQGRRAGALPPPPEGVPVRAPSVLPPPPRAPGQPPPPPLGARLGVPPLGDRRQSTVPKAPEPTAPAGGADEELEIEVEFLDADDGIVIEEGTDSTTLDLALLRRLPAIPLFADMPEGAFFELTSRMKTRTFQPGDVIAQEGDAPGPVWVIIEGSAMVKVGDDEIINRLGAGDVFGEMALLLDEPRRATVVADAPLEVFEMDRALLHATMERHPEVAEVLARLVKSRLVDVLLATAPMFAAFDGPSRRDLVRRFELREVAPGTEVLTEGLPGDGLYVVVSGTFAVRRGQDHELAKLGAGSVFGEMSLLTHGEANATVEATTSAMVLRLPRKGFQETVMMYPPVLEHISALAAARSPEVRDGSIVLP